MTRVDLNADMGEGSGRDADLMRCVTSVNIACGAHAGDARTMRETLELAALHHVAAGVHPGYPDPDHFGRRDLGMTPGEVYQTVAEQIGVLREIANAVGVLLVHAKPHGALYNAAAVDEHIARAIARAVHDADPELLLYGLAGSALLVEGERAGLRTVAEAFADRGYLPDGTLAPRDRAGAVIDDPEGAAMRVLRIVTEQRVRSVSGADIEVRAETICIHGDGIRAVEIARRVRASLDEAGVRVIPPDPEPRTP